MIYIDNQWKSNDSGNPCRDICQLARLLATEISFKFMLGKLSDLNWAVFNQSIEIIG